MGNTINLYSTRTMMAAINKMMPVRTFFRDTFFPNVETFLTEKIDVDFKKGKRKMAPFVAPRIGGVTMDRQGFITKNYTIPKIAPQRVITIDNIRTRAMGESIYSLKTPEQRAAQLLGTDIAELDEYITRREEWMCRELLLNGKIIMKGIIDDKTNNVIEQEVDFKFSNKEVLSGDVRWGQSSAKIYEDLRRWRLEVIKKSGKAPNITILSSDVVDLLIKDNEIQKIFDNQRYNIGAIEPTVKNDAVTYIGKLPGLGLELYSYDEWFIDDDGTEQPMMPDGHVVMGRSGMGTRLYGAVTQMEENEDFVTYEGIRIPKYWADKQNEVKMLRLSARPLPKPEDVDDWYVAQVK
ncbi:MAG: major capsid protein [Vallitalea sp.]|nr:major capsid protein [Vallitalea sp.]